MSAAGEVVVQRPESHPVTPRLVRHRGFAMISAVFLVVVLALLGAMIVSLSTTQQVGAMRDLLGSRAYFAAKAGIEWGAYQVLQGGSCAASTTLPTLPGSTAAFQVQVVCEASPAVDEAGTAVRVVRITATATTGTLGSLDYTERQLQALMSAP